MIFLKIIDGSGSFFFFRSIIQRTTGSGFLVKNQNQRTGNKQVVIKAGFLNIFFPKKEIENHGYTPKLVFWEIFFHPNQVSENIYIYTWADDQRVSIADSNNCPNFGNENA